MPAAWDVASVPPVVPPPVEEVLPPGRPRRVHIPVGGEPDPERLRMTSERDLISLSARDASLNVVLGMIAEQHGLNLVTGDAMDEPITVTLTRVPLGEALDAILAVHGYTWSRQHQILMVSRISGENKIDPSVQGRAVRVFNLNYLTSEEVNKVVQGLVSPAGQCFATATDPKNQRRTFEQIVVEDLPSYLDRIEKYIRQVDIPPRQVIVEAHILQVNLKDELRHGVDFEYLLRVADTPVTFQMDVSRENPVTALRIKGTDLNQLIEGIKGTTDAKTLASPKVAVLNGQEARMQVGGQIGYLLTTTTQTSTMQSVSFLDVGVILMVTPIITEDNRVLLQVKPQVSTGRINATTQLPESETTEVETRVLLADGEAIVLGGLIQEQDSDTQNKIPWLGDLWLIGRLFQRRDTLRERNEIIITLLPRIVHEGIELPCEDVLQLEQASTPLFYGPLERVDRRAWEPQLPDAGQRSSTAE